MNFLQKPFYLLKKETNAGGIAYVPPAGCRLPAHTSACVPACVERTGKAVTKKLNNLGIMEPVIFNGLILVLGRLS